MFVSMTCMGATALGLESPVQQLGGARFENWTGLKPDGSGVAELNLPTPAVYQVPDGPRGWHDTGLRHDNDSTLDLRQWYGLRFDVELDRDDTPFAAEFTLQIPKRQPDRHNLLESSSARVLVQGKGWHTVTVPFSTFDYQRGQEFFLKFIQRITLKGGYEGAKPSGHVRLRNVRLVRGNVLHLASEIRSQPAEAGGSVDYSVTVMNCSDVPQLVTLAIQRSGWEGMAAEVSPATLSLPPGQSGAATVRVAVPDRIPPGAQETQILVATTQGEVAASETMKFITLRRLPAPFVVFTPSGWDDLRAKVAKYDWAKNSAQRMIERADNFEVPTVPPGGIASDQNTPAVFKSYIEGDLWSCGVAWKLTGDKKYAEKVALFLRRLADPETGYPKRLHANSQGIPQEGGFFEGCVKGYDAIQDAGVLSAEDRKNIEQTFRLYIGVVEDSMGDGGISNWSMFNLCPAAQCALAIQDLAHFDYLMNGPCGIVDHLRYGTMDDGWWYEVSLSYNLGVAHAVTALALSAKPFGIDLLNEKFPVALTQNVGLRPFEYEKFLGMAFGKFGPVKDNFITIKKMWDGIVLYPDYRGVMFGMGDGHEQAISGGPLELAYYAFRDPAYAAIIKQGSGRDLLYGVPELPAETPKLYTLSGHSDNAGIAVLRSQTEGREPREQIQAAMKFGSHGSYHGHFDNISLLSLMRYGRSFWNPETSWFGYGSYMYKWWVQPSLAHNMVVVDAKQQEPAECKLLLFHSGKMMQAIAAETTARWSQPPYLGGYNQIARIESGETSYVPIPTNHPAPGELTGFTEPVRQRRLIIVTDDYVVLADDLRGEREHTFDNLLHLRGATLPQSENVKLTGHSAQFDSDPLGSGQFITDCDRYSATAPVLIQSVHRIGGSRMTTDSFAGVGEGSKNWETGGARSLSEPGVLHLDEHALWPPQPEIVLGKYAESWSVNKKLTYEVQGDGKSLASGTFGAWILGSGNVDVDVTGLKTLQLTTKASRGDNTLKTIFWGNAVLITAAGKEIPLAQLTPPTKNVAPVAVAGKDYAGGPVCIAGNPIASSLAAEPQNAAQSAVITLDLSGLNAVRFKSVVGGDWPVGDEEQLRKTVSVRSRGKSAQFLTLIEPYEANPLVKSAVATSANTLRVELADGRIQEIKINHFADGGQDPQVEITESQNGKTIRSEVTEAAADGQH
jgi:hypothetical protein